LRKIIACAAAAIACAAAAPLAHAGPSSPTTAIVSLGDSYISGEGGRWNGNSNNQLGSRNGTDRAWVSTWYGGYYDTGRVYLDGTNRNGCHRSDVAEIRSSAIAVDERINLACSGATTANVFRASAGGQSHNGEAPQADQLAPVAAAKAVRMVVLSIGGNDLGFASIIAACTVAWTTSPSWAPNYCYDDQQAAVDARMPGAMAAVGKAIDEVRAVMAGAGYQPSDYRFVLQTYPSPVPRAAENRYPESGWSRLSTGGCPFWDRDLDWARDSLAEQIADNLRAVAAGRRVELLDLRDMLQGREVCSTSASLVGSGGPSSTASEWARFLVTGVGQGDLQESFHPNAYGQRGIGRCLALLWAASAGRYACRNTPGQSYAAMTLTAIG
jgi:lysophospholipase L1-like esterase